jgi:hypothetical protein
MKISVKNTIAIIFSNIFSIQEMGTAIIIFIVAFIALIIPLPLIFNSEVNGIVGTDFFISVVIALLFLSYKAFDSYLFVKDSYIEVQDKTVTCSFSGINRGLVSYPIEQIYNMFIFQTVIERIFGLCKININQINGSLKIYGFNYKEAVEFSNEFSKKYKLDSSQKK